MAGTAQPVTFADLDDRYGGFYTPSFEIEIGGTVVFSPAKGRASSVRVQTSIEKANRVSFDVSGVYDQSKGTFEDLSKQGLSIGNSLVVRVGYAAQSKLPTVMTGTITDVKPRFPAGGPPTISVEGHDHRYTMDQSTGDGSWENKTVDKAAASIADNYDFEGVDFGKKGPASKTGSAPEVKRLVKESESDLAFMKQLLRRFDYEMFSRGGTLYFRRPPERRGKPTASVKLAYGKGLESFQRTGGGQQQVSKVTAKGVNHSTGEQVSGSTSGPGQGERDDQRLLKAAYESDEEAKEQAKATETQLNRAQRSTATTIGLPALKIGDWVRLSGLGRVAGQRYDGLYYLLAVNHDIGGSGYTTKLTMSGPRPKEGE